MKIINVGSADALLNHHKQPPLYGCLACSWYAVTGDERFIDRHIKEVFSHRIEVFAVHMGYMALDWFNGMNVYDAPLEVFKKLLERFDNGEKVSLIVSIQSAIYPGSWHCVGMVAIKRSGEIFIQVSDSQLEHIFEYPFIEFSASPYAAMRCISALVDRQTVIESPCPDPIEQLQKSGMVLHEKNDLPLTRCAANKDGDCTDPRCPQLKEYKTGCPLYDWQRDDD